MTHKEARISKGFARQQCEAFAEEFGMTIQSGVQSVTISDGITTVEIELVADDQGVREIKIEAFGGLDQHSGIGLAHRMAVDIERRASGAVIGAGQHQVEPDALCGEAGVDMGGDGGKIVPAQQALRHA